MDAKTNENLRHLSTEEAKKIGAEGGRKSGRSRRMKKTLAERLKTLIFSRDEDGDIIGDKMNAGLVARALEGDARAYEIIRDTIGEKPAQKVQGELNVRKFEDFDD